MNEKGFTGSGHNGRTGTGKDLSCFKPPHHTPHKTREIYAITHGAEELGDSPPKMGGGWAPGENRYRATPTRAGQVALAEQMDRVGLAQEIGRVAPAWQMVSCAFWYNLAKQWAYARASELK